MGGRLSRRNFLRASGAAATSLSVGFFSRSAANPSSRGRPNVLFIAVDDLRPELGCFGRPKVHSPNLDRLAEEGVVFSRCYCQVPVCGASRASLLTGVRPRRDRFVGFDTWADKDLPGNLSLPHHFRDHGYTTLSLGKIYHHQTDGAGSWSRPAWRAKSRGKGRDYLRPENQAIAVQREGRGPAFESADVPDDAYLDGQIANQAISELRQLRDGQSPFFLAVGFLKPHLPFNAPKRYWDLYPRDEIDLADNPFSPRGAPPAALHNWGELRQYHGIPQKGPLSEDMARTMVHGYYACVSYTDVQIGRVLHELDRLGLADNTVVIVWGDHGWNLGEHGLWCKHCNFETSLRSPLMIRAPGVKGGVESRALTEFVDIYPSLCELCGLPVPEHAEGLSFVPLLRDPNRPWKTAAFSRYFAGDSVRTDRYRYTQWLDKDSRRYARMLYDHFEDPGENVNIAEDPANASIVARLSALIDQGYRAGLPDT
ncbi:MAG TPA: DUF229 domain-containing protein [Phycisphaerales bacterium]|nr:DUF229 domain-containing protein [Phycisphaerales bacterium]